MPSRKASTRSTRLSVNATPPGIGSRAGSVNSPATQRDSLATPSSSLSVSLGGRTPTGTQRRKSNPGPSETPSKAASPTKRNKTKRRKRVSIATTEGDASSPDDDASSDSDGSKDSSNGDDDTDTGVRTSVAVTEMGDGDEAVAASVDVEALPDVLQGPEAENTQIEETPALSKSRRQSQRMSIVVGSTRASIDVGASTPRRHGVLRASVTVNEMQQAQDDALSELRATEDVIEGSLLVGDDAPGPNDSNDQVPNENSDDEVVKQSRRVSTASKLASITPNNHSDSRSASTEPADQNVVAVPTTPKTSGRRSTTTRLTVPLTRPVVVAPPPPPTISLLPGEIATGRRGSIHIGQSPLHLTDSEINLLATTTGSFRGGAGDVHFRFLRGNRSRPTVRLAGPAGQLHPIIAGQVGSLIKEETERANSRGKGAMAFLLGRKTAAQLARERARGVVTGPIQATKVTVGMLNGMGDGLTVGKAPDGGFRRQIRSLAAEKAETQGQFKRQKAREITRSFLMTKWENLEQTRLMIVTKMSSLKHYYLQLTELKRENDELRERHAHVSKTLNDSVSSILIDIERAGVEIARLERERRQKRRALKADFAAFEKQATLKRNQMENFYRDALRSVEIISRDHENLIILKEQLKNDPLTLERQVQALLDEKEKLHEHHDDLLKEVRITWEEEQKEVDAACIARVKILVDNMSAKLEGKIDLTVNGDVHRNIGLIRELDIHKVQQAKLLTEIDSLLKARKEIEATKAKMGDGRRRVMAGMRESLLGCTPEMEFELDGRQRKNLGLELVSM